jgi:hypothetical protein
LDPPPTLAVDDVEHLVSPAVRERLLDALDGDIFELRITQATDVPVTLQANDSAVRGGINAAKCFYVGGFADHGPTEMTVAPPHVADACAPESTGWVSILRHVGSAFPSFATGPGLPPGPSSL